MRRGYYPSFIDSAPEEVRRRDEEIDRLKEQVSDLQSYIIYMATQRSPDPDRVHELLIRSALKLETWDDLWTWEREALHGLVDIAEVDPTGCAYCPLCGGGVRDDWGTGKRRGFRYPIGLEYHLEGTGRASQCFIMKTAFKWARDSKNRMEKFHAAAAAAERQKQETHEARRQTERLFLVDPTKPPKLIDEDVRDHRSAEQLDWAETRLQTLNCRFDLNGNVMAYRLPHPDFIILADPREQRWIMFSVFEREPGRSGKTHEMFYLRDRWIKDISARFRAKLEDACNRLRT